MAPACAIHARGLSKVYEGRRVVDGIELCVPRGICFGLLGPNGAGKTTTLRMLLGLTPPSTGELTVLGRPMPQAVRTIRGRIGVVPQADNLDPDLTVVENLRIYAAYFGLPRAHIEERIPALLEFARLEGRADARVEGLSGGMKRRLTLARALINDPELIVLDEPTTGLDPQSRHLLWGRLEALRARGTTLVLTTHYLDEAERLCDELVVMDHGRVLDRGSPRELITRHVEPEVIEVRGLPLGAPPPFDVPAECRVEWHGSRMVIHTRDGRACMARLGLRPELTVLHRPAGLEDVFLCLTGRDLRDA